MISIYARGNGHWDITDGTRRVFAVRGGLHDDSPFFHIRDERPTSTANAPQFLTADAAVGWCVSMLMAGEML